MPNQTVFPIFWHVHFCGFPRKNATCKEIAFEYIVLYANPAKKCNFFTGFMIISLTGIKFPLREDWQALLRIYLW